MTTTQGRLAPFRPRTMRRQRAITGYLFISPFILGFLIWFVLPALTAAWLVFYDWNMIRQPIFIGWRNFEKLIEDPLFLQSLKVTTIYTLLSVPLSLVLSFLLALLMNTKVRGIAFFRTVYYLPSIVPAVANAMLWIFIFHSEFGLLNAFLRMVGLKKILWLQDDRWALSALILMSLWALGSSMVIYLAGLQGIPEALYEAAEIDGAGRWARLWNVTIPLISPVLFFNLIISIIGSFQVFTAGYLMTKGGPKNATLFYVLYTYNTAIRYMDMGYASVLAWVLFFIMLGLTLIIVRYVGRMVYYEDVG
jgi:multiple sugar transport system permease protein